MNSLILPWYVSSTETHVPNVVGLSQEQAMAAIEEADLEPVVATIVYNDKVPKGLIADQKPYKDKLVKAGRNVYLYVSGGEQIINAPSLLGKNIKDARIILERLGLRLGSVEEVVSSQATGLIFDQQYSIGTPLKKGQSINVSISRGQIDTTFVPAPEVLGLSLAEAQNIIRGLGLNVGSINYQISSSLNPNTIIDQYPSQGTPVKRGGTIDLFVIKEPGKPTDDKEVIE